MANEVWEPYKTPLAVSLPITAVQMHLQFPAGRYLIEPPIVFATVIGAATNVNITSIPKMMTGVGNVYQDIDLFFQPEAVGKMVNIWVMGA